MIKVQLGGSPCTYWSIARTATNSPITRETKNEGLGWELYLNYEIALEKFQPDVWLYENVASMHKYVEESITARLGRPPHIFDGGKVSAAARLRDYWTNAEGVQEPAEKGLVLRDIMEDSVPEKYYYNIPFDFHGLDKPVCATLHIKGKETTKRVNSPNFKCHTLTAVAGGHQHKKVYDNGRCRKLTPVEYERCQTLPDGYTSGVADGPRYKALGNGWCADMVIHILSYALDNVPRDEELVVLSMYDGIATGRYCLDKMGFKNVTYYAYEIDDNAIKIAKKNWPDIIHLGDAFAVRAPEWRLPDKEAITV